MLYRDLPEAAALDQIEEIRLAEILAMLDAEALELLGNEHYVDAMAALARLRGPIDAFFDKVTVNVATPTLRVNRLRILGRIRQAMDQIADFSKIEG